MTSTSPTPGTGPVPSPPGKKLPPVDAKSAQQTDEILNSILPPREWTENGQLWVSGLSIISAQLPIVDISLPNIPVTSHLRTLTSVSQCVQVNIRYQII